jgi:quercetin dioxygenase-like cupin family protein
MITFVPHTERAWREVAPGVEFSNLRAHDGENGLTLLVRMAKGALARLHHHPGGEETFILSGKLRVGEHHLVAGDYLWTPPGVAHEGHAEEETMFFVVLPDGLLLEPSGG